MRWTVSRRALKRAVWLACAGPGILSGGAAAQTGPAPPSAPILVTGSRIPDPATREVEPVLSLPGRRVEDRALTNIAEALGEVPGYRGSITPTGDNAAFGQGVNFISLFGLGSHRTLVLVDGRRIVSSNVPSILGNAPPGTQVDLNAIPAILIDRVDRVAIGGAPVYGTDAIAGTVNLRLRRKLEGLETRATTAITQQGDGLRRNLSAAGGFTFAQARGNLTAALSHDRVSGIRGTQSAFFRANLGNATNPCTVILAGTCSAANLVQALGPAGRTAAGDGRVNPAIGFNDRPDDGFPGSVLIRDLTLPAVSRGGVLSAGSGAYAWQFAPDGNLMRYDKGTLFGAAVPGPLAAAAMASGGDGLSLGDYLPISSDLTRLNAALALSWEPTARLRLFTDGLLYHGQADELVQLPSFNAPLFAGASGPLTFRTDNPFLSAQARQQLAALGYAGTFQLSRAHADLADLSGRSDSRLHRIVAGLQGKLALGRRDYDFEISLNYGRNRFIDHGQSIDQQKFVNAVNVALEGGRIVCSLVPTVTGFPAGQVPVADPACVPLNLFGEGAPSRAARDYVLRDTVSRSRLEQFVVNANLGGTPFALFGNPAAFNLGYEHHAEKASFQPDPFLQAGKGRSVAVAPTAGSYRLDEVFGEMLLPLVTPTNGLPFSRLTLIGRLRHVASSASPSFTAWTAGGLFAPVAGIELRGNLTRSFRAPSITELHSPRGVVMTAVPDLCSPAQIGAGPAPAIRRANCAAFLARYPGATPLAAATVTVPARSGGNPALASEKADSFTYGAVLRPALLPGLLLSADYLDIRVRDPIASLTVNQIAQGCFDNADFDTGDPARANAFCALIRRDGNGQVVADPQDPAVTLGYVNGKRIRMSGVQASASYAGSLAALGLAGTIELGGDLFHLRRRVVDVTGIAPARSDGVVGDPRWQGQLRLRYAREPWGLAVQVNYTGRRAIARGNRGDSPNDTREFDHFRGFATADLSLFIEAAQGFRLTAAATNIFDRTGQRYHGEIVPLSLNDQFGRRFALSLRAGW